MDPLHRIAEKKIEEALARGAFDDYAGKGEPMELEDVSRLDPEVRAAYLGVKGHGYVSEESQLRADIVSLHTLLATATDDGERDRLTREERRLHLRFSLLLEKRGVPFDVIEQLVRGLGARAKARGEP